MPVIGTAGHVDHGKSTLLEKLTGRNPMHLPEEHARGLTIELGFSYWRSPSGRECGIVDVPGHGTFVRNMAGGAYALDGVLFVVAADDGWKPQSEEHFFICRSVRIPRGIVVITKADLVSERQLEDLRDELELRLADTFLDGAPIIPWSAFDPSSHGNLIGKIDEMLASIPPAPDIAKPRIWADRSFKIEGAGHIITGTLAGGGIKSGDEMHVYPQGVQARVKRIEMHGRNVQAVPPGSRVALNLAVPGRYPPERGSLLSGGKPPKAAEEIWANIEIAPSWEPGLKSGGTYLGHLGTASFEIRVFPEERRKLGPGERAVARLTVSPGAPAEIGDHIIVFSSSRHGVVAACEVVYADSIPKRSKTSVVFSAMKACSPPEPESTVLLKSAISPTGISALEYSTKFSLEACVKAAESLASEGRIVIIGDSPDKFAVGIESLAALNDILEKQLPALASEPSNLDGIPFGRFKLPVDLPEQFKKALLTRFAAGLSGWTAREQTLIREGATTANIESDPAAQRVLARFNTAVSEYPTLKQLYFEFQRDKKAVTRLLEEKILVRCPGDIVIPAKRLAALKSILVELLKRRESLTVPEIKDAWGLTRKHAIPLLEYFDSIGLTARGENVRTRGPKFPQ
ncbi:MAG: SelB C-terminal domain-containing protein [bacterium]|jgi:selenocysteine-specific elongation factor